VGGEEDKEGEKGGKSGNGKLLGGGALLNAGPAHLFGVGEGPLFLGGEPLSTCGDVLSRSTCFSKEALRGLCGDKGELFESVND